MFTELQWTWKKKWKNCLSLYKKCCRSMRGVEPVLGSWLLWVNWGTERQGHCKVCLRDTLRRTDLQRRLENTSFIIVEILTWLLRTLHLPCQQMFAWRKKTTATARMASVSSLKVPTTRRFQRACVRRDTSEISAKDVSSKGQPCLKSEYLEKYATSYVACFRRRRL